MKRLTDSFAFCSCSKPLRAGLWFVQHSLALLRTLRYSLYLSDDLLLWRETGWPHINANKNASCNGDHSIFPLFFFSLHRFKNFLELRDDRTACLQYTLVMLIELQLTCRHSKVRALQTVPAPQESAADSLGFH